MTLKLGPFIFPPIFDIIGLSSDHEIDLAGHSESGIDETQPKLPEIVSGSTGQTSTGMAFCGGLQEVEKGILLPSLIVKDGFCAQAQVWHGLCTHLISHLQVSVPHTVSIEKMYVPGSEI